LLGGKPVWRWSYEVFNRHAGVDDVLLVGGPGNIADLRSAGRAILGGDDRRASSRLAVDACADSDIVLLHDAARPFVTSGLISRVIRGVEERGAATPAIPVTDTIKEVRDEGIFTLDRSRLFAVQTPQGARRDLLIRAHAIESGAVTDDMSLLEQIGVHPALVDGDPRNIKITSPEDLERAEAHLMGGETRTGLGYDVHAYSSDPSRALFLGGVHFEGHRGLEGHSDADVLLHAVTDSLLGACALGDIGQHFPNSDPRWRGEPSVTFLAYAARLIAERGWRVVNIDATVIAESPKIMSRVLEIRSAIASAIACEVERISVKATTNEKLGTIGRGEGIAAFATATVRST
jgi:2-C-methyl-D-erythritol 4-phosphate cytidylyltransferase/2-C-methyl-D-erythritol 2,4-cyclodiphosphate synthase